MPIEPEGHQVLLTRGAERDLESIHDYIAEFDSVESADRLLEQLLQLTRDLSLLPERGSHPRELTALGIKTYRQVLLPPYRVIYRVFDTRVVIYLIVDGRRDMQSALTRRLLGG